MESGSWIYELRVMGENGTLLVNAMTKPLTFTTPTEFLLKGPYPNPSDQRVTFLFNTPKKVLVNLEVYDSLGRLVAILPSKVLEPGKHVIAWNGRRKNGGKLSAGVYFVRFLANPESGGSKSLYKATKKIIIGIR